MFKTTITIFALSLCFANSALAQSPLDNAHMGPVIENFGPVFDVPDASFELKKGVQYKAVMDLSESPETDGELNKGLESVARYLNMNVDSGMNAEDLEVAVVVHGKAGQDLLSDEASNKHFGRPNPNTALLKELNEAGVKVYLCGQSAAFRGYTLAEMNPIVSMAISAMSAHVRLEAEGYSLIPF